MKVYLSLLAETKLLKLSEHLLENWNLKIRDQFIEKLTERIKQISMYPESCPKSIHFDGLFKCVVTKQNTFYYRVNFDLKEIEIITMFDTRQDPDTLNKEIK